MRLLTIPELMLLTCAQPLDHPDPGHESLPGLAEGSPERDNALTSLRNFTL